MYDEALHVFEVTGNTSDRRIGKVFPSGWTPLARKDGAPLWVATHSACPYSLRGTTVRPVGTITLRELVKRQAA